MRVKVAYPNHDESGNGYRNPWWNARFAAPRVTLTIAVVGTLRMMTIGSSMLDRVLSAGDLLQIFVPAGVFGFLHLYRCMIMRVDIADGGQALRIRNTLRSYEVIVDDIERVMPVGIDSGGLCTAVRLRGRRGRIRICGLPFEERLAVWSSLPAKEWPTGPST